MALSATSVTALCRVNTRSGASGRRSASPLSVAYDNARKHDATMLRTQKATTATTRVFSSCPCRFFHAAFSDGDGQATYVSTPGQAKWGKATGRTLGVFEAKSVAVAPDLRGTPANATTVGSTLRNHHHERNSRKPQSPVCCWRATGRRKRQLAKLSPLSPTPRNRSRPDQRHVPPRTEQRIRLTYLPSAPRPGIPDGC